MVMAFLRSQAVFLFAIVVSILILALLVNLGEDNSHRELLQSDPTLIPDVSIEDVFLIQSTGERIDWNIAARAAVLFESEDRIEISLPQVEVRAKGGLAIRFEGERGTLNMETHDFVIENEKEDMNVYLNNGYTVTTKGVQWKERERLITSSSSVVIRGPNVSLTGNSLQVDTENQEMLVRGQVQGVIENSS
jgi:LPS export ABC transporter protein LptC